MVVVGADVHRRAHTFVAVDEVGKKLGEKVVSAPSSGHHQVLRWTRERLGAEVVWAIEDCRHLSARPERDLLTAGQQGSTGPVEVNGPDPRVGTDSG